jgi:Ni,Fe-hydrogenase III component G
LKQGDIGTELIFTINDKNGKIVDLLEASQASIIIKAKNHYVKDVCEILEPKNEGKVKYTIQEGDLAVAGDYEIEIVLSFYDGDTFTSSRIYEYVEDKLTEVR